MESTDASTGRFMLVEAMFIRLVSMVDYHF
jgi:hypothetical protein